MKIYNLTISEEIDGLECVSLVANPAVVYNFLCFDEDKKKETVKLKFNSDKHIITGIAALADTPIYRYDDIRGEWYAVLSKDTIEKMVIKMSEKNLLNKVNLQHNDNEYVDGQIVMFESYLVNRSRGIIPAEFPDIPDGSWIVSYKVTDDNLWDKIVNGNEINGFSIQGFFDLVETQFNENQEKETEIEDLDNIVLNLFANEN